MSGMCVYLFVSMMLLKVSEDIGICNYFKILSIRGGIWAFQRSLLTLSIAASYDDWGTGIWSDSLESLLQLSDP